MVNFPNYGYILILAVSLSGLAVLDSRYHLAFWHNAKQSAMILGISVGFFLAWDFAGILLGIFRTNQSFVTGVHLVTRNLPIEEVMLLTLIAYLTLLGSVVLERRAK